MSAYSKQVWEAASTLKFTKTTSDTHDIDVRFGSDSGSSTHLDDDLTSYIDNNVEGRFGRSTLAHAFFPFAPTANTYPNKFSGDAHFNEDVTWIKPGCGGGKCRPFCFWCLIWPIQNDAKKTGK